MKLGQPSGKSHRSSALVADACIGGCVALTIAQWVNKWQPKYAKLCSWVEESIEETLTYFRLPIAHHKHMKSTNMLKRRTHVVRIIPNEASCLRLVRALAVETHENWLEAIRYLNMDHYREHQKEMLRQAA
jgi:putative transposase